MSVHQVRELEYFLFSELQGRSWYLSYGCIEANVQTFQFATRHSDDSLYLLSSEVCLVELHHLYVGDAAGEDVGVHHVEVVVTEVDLLQLCDSTHLTENNVLVSAFSFSGQKIKYVGRNNKYRGGSHSETTNQSRTLIRLILFCVFFCNLKPLSVPAPASPEYLLQLVGGDVGLAKLHYLQPVEGPGRGVRGNAGDVDVAHAEHVQVGGGAHLPEHGVHLPSSELRIVKVCLSTPVTQ